jgi:crotonobetainyl-CoA:carnitine CoA-transferase CaiB-like acyl-CoA transferase
MPKALHDVRVIDVSRLLTGPYCTMVLADLGADVIKVEVPGRGDDSRLFGPFTQGESGYFMTLNRNKRGITLDLRKPEGKAVFKELVRSADVLLENFTAGTMEEWGLGYEELSKINSKLIYASITGFGQYGPYSNRVAFDAIAQAMGGLMSITGHPTTPPTRVGTSLGDINAGVFAATSILAALHQRTNTHRGQRIDISMHDCIFAILENAVVRNTIGGQVPTRIGSRHASVTPYDVFQAKDGYLLIACANEATWQRLCKAMGQDGLIQDERFLLNAKRTENVESLTKIINDWLSCLTMGEALKILEDSAVPSAPVKSIDELVNDPHLIARNMVAEVVHPVAGKTKIPGVPTKLEDSPDSIERPAPVLGQHTEEVLMEIGYSKEQVQGLREQGII